MTETLRRRWWSLRVRLWALRTAAPSGPLYYNGGGLGDDLMLTAVAKAARAAGRPIHVLTDWSGLWVGNQDALSVNTGVERWFYAQRRGWFRNLVIKHLTTVNESTVHLGQQQATHLGLTLPVGWAPVLAYPPKPHNPRRIVFQLSCRGAKYAADTKEWAHERWLALLARFAPDFELVQLGTDRDPAVPGAVDLRGRTTLAEAAAWIASSAVFIGLESGLMHLAAATRVPAVIIYGGRTAPTLTGYPWHTHLVRTPPCAGCALNTGCPHDRICLDIPVDEVEAAVRAKLKP